MEIKLLNFDIKGNEKGSIIALEQYKNIPFEIKRVYYIFGTKEGVRRGFHAHKRLEQVLICMSGSIKIKVDNGKEKRIIKLNNPSKGLYIGPGIWREMYDFDKIAVLLVLASEYFSENDYIRDYEEFKCYKKQIDVKF